MNCPEFQTEFEERRPLSETAELHRNDCSSCARLFAEQTRVWQMIETLPRVDAPKDFNFHLKAKIANAKPTDFQPRWWSAVRYVTPVFAVVLVLTLIFASQNFFVSDQNVAEQRTKTPVSNPIEQKSSSVAGVSHEAAPAEVVKTPEEKINDEKVVAEKTPEKESVVLAKLPKENKTVPNSKTENETGIRSRDISSEKNKVMILPLGIELNNQPKKTPEPKESSNFTADQMLSEIGIELITENGKQIVKTIKEKSAADISGVKVGDTIEAIDGKKIGSQPDKVKSSATKKLTVVRDQETIEINLRTQ